MTDVLLLGSFHFMQSDWDFYSSVAQTELDTLAQALLRFTPDAVAVEAAAHQQDIINAAYQKFDLRDLQNADKMRTETLGNIRMYNDVHPIKYNNETIQIGFRLAKMQGLPKVHAIDDDSEIDGEPFEHPSADVQKSIKKYSDYTAQQKLDTIIDNFRYLNSTSYARLNHLIYLRVNAMGSSEDYSGAKSIAQWYERNLKIFSNIQRMAEQYTRIFIVYGAGHLHILRDLICADDRLNLVDVMDYLPVLE